MKGAQIRARFLEYFRDRGHEVVASSSLVPANDPTLLFTNAGMVQFKDVFLGSDPRSYKRAATSQRCVRAGGKHNDLENVGYTARHHTFFEMLGNFSFGDYFKREAIEFAWELVTKVYGLPEERLWVTVFRDDDEAADLWLKHIGVPKERFARMGEKDNFWSMGDTGPCGPCSEIFYDHGPDVAGGPPGSPDEDGDRYVEIWNLVFMQFDRAADGTMTPLPKPSVDTGMGLERIAAVLQGKHSNYDTDLFVPLIDAAAKLAGLEDKTSSSLRVIADHIRACSFLIVDGVLPSNEGRGYVLRRIIRRAIRHGYKLDLKEPFFNRLVRPLDALMGDAYPELRDKRAHVEKVLLREEERFAETLDQGMRILDDAIASLPGNVIPGDTVFKLYDTYGFPIDLTADIARERGLTVDQAGFDAAMAEQRERARAAGKFKGPAGSAGEAAVEGVQTQFTGYTTLRDSGRVVALLRDDAPVDELNAGERGGVILDRTPFYAESGGQVGDQGVLRAGDSVFRVEDTQKVGKAYVHLGLLEAGTLEAGAEVDADVDAALRAATVLNHSATHLMHAALREVLGTHVVQKGSLVAPDRLRFDFSHYEPVTPEQLATIERIVNEQIRINVDADIRELPFQEAIDEGALAFFDEKYGERVRVLKLGDFSMELCGGTHVARSGDIGLFKITGESGIAAGIRRIEAVTGEGALAWVREGETQLKRVAELVKGGRQDVEDKVRRLVEHARAADRELRELKAQRAGQQGADLAGQAVDVERFKVLAARLDGADDKTLRDTVDKLKDRLGSAIVVLGAVVDGKVRLVAGVTKNATSQVKAGELIGKIAERVGGRGGGRPDMAQAGGTDPSALDDALAAVPELVRERLAEHA